MVQSAGSRCVNDAIEEPSPHSGLIHTRSPAPARPAPVVRRIMPLFVWLLWTLLRGTVGGPVQRATWSEGFNPAPVAVKQDGATRASFYHLPMFQHALRPFVPRELFRPVPHKRPLPAGLTALLLPPAGQQQEVQGTSARAVEAFCGYDKISVRVDLFQLRSWSIPSLFRLGTCEPSLITPRYLYFHYRLTECGGESQVGRCQ